MTKTLDETRALARRMEALADPAQESMPTYENTDWRGLANTCAHALRELIADAERMERQLQRCQDGRCDKTDEYYAALERNLASLDDDGWPIYPRKG